MLRPARAVSYRKLIERDILPISVYWFGMVPIAEYIDGLIAVRPHLPQAIHEMPLLFRLLCCFLIADFGHYWIHRLMHTNMFGVFISGTIRLPYVLARRLSRHDPARCHRQPAVAVCLFILDLSPFWMVLAISLFNQLQNDWMHVNIAWRSNSLEWLIVTPRYHYIHHSDKPEHYMANLAALFTVWDRLFGTYMDPESVKEELSFGIGEEVPPLRLVLGV
jgi:sterol desaturase/sphingolipid hydroxylase (fatty acid hydroxylase superfamily)